MAYDKIVDSTKLDGAIKQTANSIRSKTGSTGNIVWDETNGFKNAVDNITVKSDPVLQEKSVSPKTSAQTVTPDSGYDGLSKVSVGAIPTVTQATPTMTINTGTGVVTAKSVQSAGYVESGTKTNTLNLSTQSGKTVTPSTSEITAVNPGKYTLDYIKVKGDPNLISANIKQGVSIFGVAGAFAGGGGLAYATGTVTPLTTSASSSGTTIFSVSGLSFTPKFVAVRMDGRLSSLGSKYNITSIFGGLTSGSTCYDSENTRIDSEPMHSVTLNSNGFVIKTNESKDCKYSNQYSYIAIGEGSGDDE